ncbi:uncharacterized protein LOC131010514 [Salvia miltiorrhiza]|uniref:uncharacterized protein LOC131010514 n=1 Tax=Salvia miltiorrhiza TaxID=226208 RepID=UPI0025ABC860|nr:uncharacterized protein LOC131010514 [Salvia miltiorrhiza]
MATQKKRLEQMEKMVDDLQTTVGSVAGKVEGLEGSMASVESTLASILAQLRNLTKTRGPEITGEKTTPPPGGGGLQEPSFPRMDLPIFDGTDPIAWLAQSEQYFLVHRTPLSDRVQLALIAMSGRAIFWAQWVLRRSASIEWSQFSQELIERFGDSSAINAYEAMHITRQTGSLEEYLALFEERIAQLPELPPAQYLGMFLGGLHSSVRDRITESDSVNVFTAIRAARRISRSSRGSSQPPQSSFPSTAPLRSTASFRGGAPVIGSTPATSFRGGNSAVSGGFRNSTPTPNASGQSANNSSTASSGIRGNRKSRHLTEDQIKEYLAQGKCFRCSQPYGPLHKCPSQFLNVILLGDGDPPEDSAKLDLEDHTLEEFPSLEPELQHLQLSKLSSKGFDGPRTLELFSAVGGFKLLTMIDSGASHCFISETVASSLQLPVEPTSTQTVVLSDGSRVHITGVCKAVPLKLDSQLFLVTCFVFPLSSVDVILGVSWLATLGDVTANWSNLTMEFYYQGTRVCLRGDPSLTRRACTKNGILTFNVGRSDFPHVTSAPAGLTPQRAGDHRIVPKEGTSPVSVRPYRYNHSQKDEMEKLAGEMLEAGIIQPSNSPYPSPVLLQTRSMRQISPNTGGPSREPTIDRKGSSVDQVLIQWQGLPDDESTWRDVADVRGQFPDFSLEDKAASSTGAVDRDAQRGVTAAQAAVGLGLLALVN